MDTVNILKPKLLFADKGEGVRECLKLTFAEENYSLFTASDVDEAIYIILQEKPNLIISDVSKNYFDGFRLLEELNRRAIEIKIIILSGIRPDAYTLSRAMKWGVYDYVLKPFRSFDMINKVKYCLHNDSLTRSALIQHTPLEMQLITQIESGLDDFMWSNELAVRRLKKNLSDTAKELVILRNKIEEKKIKISYKRVEGDIEKYKIYQLVQCFTVSSWIKIGLFLIFLLSLGISIGKYFR